MRMTNYRPPIPNPNKIIINMRMINYRHYYVRYGRDSKYHVVSSTQIPWWLRVRYENELNFELEHRKNLFNKAVNVLNQRDREILEFRRLKEKPKKLEELSQKYNISRERVRQIEEKAVEKLKKEILNLHK